MAAKWGPLPSTIRECNREIKALGDNIESMRRKIDAAEVRWRMEKVGRDKDWLIRIKLALGHHEKRITQVADHRNRMREESGGTPMKILLELARERIGEEEWAEIERKAKALDRARKDAPLIGINGRI